MHPDEPTLFNKCDVRREDRGSTRVAVSSKIPDVQLTTRPISGNRSRTQIFKLPVVALIKELMHCTAEAKTIFLPENTL